MTLSRRSFLGFLAMLPTLPSALAALAKAPRRAVSRLVLLFNGMPVVEDPNCPPGMMYLVNRHLFDPSNYADGPTTQASPRDRGGASQTVG